VKLVFATQNPHKLLEAKQIIRSRFELISLAELNFYSELPETHFTICENAIEKAAFIYDLFHQNCFAEDAGLEVEAMNGEPGVFSARYAGLNRSKSNNVHLVLKKMKGVENRAAKFRAVICLFLNGNYFLFEGLTDGTIAQAAEGNFGFGYDPIFIPKGFDKTYAQMDSELKNSIDHRGKAMSKMLEFLDPFQG